LEGLLQQVFFLFQHANASVMRSLKQQDEPFTIEGSTALKSDDQTIKSFSFDRITQPSNV
jgi:hypothetical protein